jgi:Tfp pilus assembly protein PilX
MLKHRIWFAGSARHHGGATLLFVGVMLLLTTASAAAALHFLLSNKQALAHRLDREIAFRGAEVALLDAEAELLAAAAGRDDGVRLGNWPAPGQCGSGAQLGLCRGAPDTAPVWQAWLRPERPLGDIGVPLGTFTNARLPGLPDGAAGTVTLPRYVVELISERPVGEQLEIGGVGRGGTSEAARPPRLRITAVGQGRDPAVRAVLQTVLQP